MKTLLKENNSLNKQIQKLQEQLNAKSKEQFGKYTFDEIANSLKNKNFIIPAKLAGGEKDVRINALKLFILYFDTFVTDVSNEYDSSDDIVYVFYHIAPYYVSFDLLEKVKLAGKTAQRIQITKTGAAFYAMLESKEMTQNT